eukprot:5346692-Pleurochrysis_carterae.AAC.1
MIARMQRRYFFGPKRPRTSLRVFRTLRCWVKRTATTSVRIIGSACSRHSPYQLYANAQPLFSVTQSLMAKRLRLANMP